MQETINKLLLESLSLTCTVSHLPQPVVPVAIIASLLHLSNFWRHSLRNLAGRFTSCIEQVVKPIESTDGFTWMGTCMLQLKTVISEWTHNMKVEKHCKAHSPLSSLLLLRIFRFIGFIYSFRRTTTNWSVFQFLGSTLSKKTRHAKTGSESKII
jgi:hypothetical protein